MRSIASLAPVINDANTIKLQTKEDQAQLNQAVSGMHKVMLDRFKGFRACLMLTTCIKLKVQVCNGRKVLGLSSRKGLL